MPSPVTFDVAFWNTWLLRPRLWRGGPAVPLGDRLFAPDVQERAPLVGAAIRDRFDVIALSEAFETSEQTSVHAALPGTRLIAGPTAGAGRFTGSGLATVVDERRVKVLDVASLRFRADGDFRDSDRFANKGALLVRVQVAPGLPPVDIVSTHLFAGGDLLPIPGAADTARHHQVRLGQIDELVAFVADNRQASNPLVVLGDFNVMAYDPALPDPTSRYQDLAERMAPLGVRDVWADHGVGAGSTCTFAHAADLPPDPDEPDQVLDDADSIPATSAGERIDYLWVGAPTAGGVTVEVDRPRRWAFTGRAARGGPAGSLSDHLCLSARLTFHPTSEV